MKLADISTLTVDYYQREILRLRQKREELVKKRDRLNQQIANIDGAIEQNSPAEVARRKKVWDKLVGKET